MAGRDKESQAIIGAAMRYVKSGDRSELESFSLQTLKKADYQLSNRDVGSGYRRAIENLINELDVEHQMPNQSNIINVKSKRYLFGFNLKETWHESFIGKVVVAVISGVLLLFIAYFINKYVLHTTPVHKTNIEETAVYSIEIPIHIESTWDEYSDLDRKAEFHIVRTESPGSQSVIYSGSAKVKIPKGGLTVNEMISIAPHKTTKTAVILPKVKALNSYLEEGGYEIQLVLFNKHGHVFTHMGQYLFDEEIINREFRYWFRLMPNQIPNKLLNKDAQ